MNEENQDIKIELSDEIEAGVYSNLAVVMHSQSEFVMDFVHLLPNTPKAKVKSRVILSPDNMKRLMYSIQANVEKFENEFGTIKLPEMDYDELDINKITPTGEA